MGAIWTIQNTLANQLYCAKPVTILSCPRSIFPLHQVAPIGLARNFLDGSILSGPAPQSPHLASAPIRNRLLWSPLWRPFFCAILALYRVIPCATAQSHCRRRHTKSQIEDTEMAKQTPNEPTGDLTIRTVAMPADTNPAGDIFGGWVLSQMDIAGGIAAWQVANGRTVTVAVEAMTFIAPIKVGDILCVYTRILKTGKTSISVGMEAWVRRNLINKREIVTEGTFIYVAMDKDGNKRSLET